MEKYFRCNKCGGAMFKTELETFRPICTAPMVGRTSGICGGSISNEITEEEYNTKIKEWEEQRNKKDV
jgi:hypothetical protein